MAKKFNLTELLNQRSKELEAEEIGAEREESGTAQAVDKEEIVMVDVYDLIPSKENFYRVDDELKRSIELFGILQPLLVKRPENGKYRVIAGHRRRLAVLALMDEGKEQRRYIPCVYKKEDIRDRLALIMANRFREKTDWEKMMEAVESEELAKELKTDYRLNGRTREILSEITGVTEAQLGRYKAIYNNLNADLMEAFRADRINVSVAVELSGLPEEWQKKAKAKLEESGTLSLPEIKELKKQEEEGRQIPGQMDLGKYMNAPQEPEEEEETAEEEGQSAGEPEEEYLDPQPEEVISLCYSCANYETCHEKKSTVKSCNAYINREEDRKTEQQKYDEEQEELDRETNRRLQEKRQEEKMERLPSENGQTKTHEVKLASAYYEDVKTGRKTFELRKNDRKYKEGDRLHMLEFTDGRHTGRTITAEIIYMLEDYTGLTEGYCILGIRVLEAD